MIIELNQLPQAIQQQILTTTDPIQIVNNGKVIKHFTPTKSYAEGDFSFDLDRMKKAVEAPSIVVPKFDTPEQLLAWMDSLTSEDFVERV